MAHVPADFLPVPCMTMGLDYTAGCVNFRDVGEWLNAIAGQPLLRHGRLLRGGKLDHVTTAAAIGAPRTVLNLRRGADQPSWLFGAHSIHFPADDSVENYDTRHPRVRRWLTRVVHTVAGPETEFPLLIHCTSGKDRTGVAVAAILSAAGVDRALIIEEYLLSDGGVQRQWIEQALDGFATVNGYFAGVDVSVLQHQVCLDPLEIAE